LKSRTTRIKTLVVTCTLFCGSAAYAEEIRVVTSGGFAAALHDLAPAFERTAHMTVVVAEGSTMGREPTSIPNRLARGEAIDVVILSSASVDEFIGSGKVLAGSRADLGRSGIGMAVRAGARKPDISSVDALKRTLVEAKSIAYSSSISGVYLSTELFQRLGVADQVLPKSRRIDGERVGAVVARGEAEIGFQQVSELVPIAGIDYVGPLPADVQRITTFSAGIVASSRNADGARALIRFLSAPEAVPTISKTGLEPAAARSSRDLAYAPQRAADGVAINDDGEPQYSTFSLCAIDPATGQSGASVTTRVPFVGRAVPHVRAGVGAVCTQASTVVEYGPRGLDLLAKGVEPDAVLAQLLADDGQRESRQVGVIDMKGHSAAHTGKQNGNWAGSRQGKTYTVQANIMVGPEVVDAVATTFEASEGTGMPLAERMILAMEAGYAKGGDRRWGNLQSAAIKIADPNDPGRGGDFVTLAIEVGEHPEPVAEMKRIYYTTGRRLGYRSFSRVEGPDVVELKRMLHVLGYWRPSLAAFPDAPPPPNTPRMRDLQKSDPAQYEKQMAAARRAAADYARDFALFDEEAIASVDKFRADRKLDYQGNTAGLVDARLIDALRAAYFEKKRSAAKP
jgi:molybdate transport system substrate-binding protein